MIPPKERFKELVKQYISCQTVDLDHNVRKRLVERVSLKHEKRNSMFMF